MALGQGDPVILCGHSRGGIVASAAAEREPSVIQALVYITAFMLPSGTSLRMFQAQAPNAAFDRGISPAADGAAVRFDPVIARSVLYHRAPRRLREAACARLVAEPVTPLVTPMSLTEARFGGIPRHYIECIDDRALLLARQREMQQRLPCASVTSLDSDHSPFLCCPASLANALMAVVV
jgi:pimeloyl-ACP methyl ester carboxylesterase